MRLPGRAIGVLAQAQFVGACSCELIAGIAAFLEVNRVPSMDCPQHMIPTAASYLARKGAEVFRSIVVRGVVGLFAIVISSPAWAAIAYVQSKSTSQNNSAQTTITANFTAAQAGR